MPFKDILLIALSVIMMLVLARWGYYDGYRTGHKEGIQETYAMLRHIMSLATKEDAHEHQQGMVERDLESNESLDGKEST